MDDPPARARHATTHVALLRAVNIAGRGMVAMSDVRAALQASGFTDVRTVLQSGNVVFRKVGAAPKLEGVIETALRKGLGVETEVFVRSVADWKALIANTPFGDEASGD